MKKYIIMIGSVSGMGGGQMYARNKMVTMKNKGYDVYIFTSRTNNQYHIQEFIGNDHTYECLSILPFLISSKQVQKQIERMKHVIQYDSQDEIIIESTTPIISLWAEILAESIHAHHIAYMLDEVFLIPANYISYFDFKYDRKELWGIKDNSLDLIFQNHRTILDSASYYLPATCTNVVENIDHPILSKIGQADIVLASIGRLDKPYVPSLIEQVIQFANKYPEKQIQMVFIGGTETKGLLDTIFEPFKNVANLTYICTDFMFPIPEKIFDLVDAFISTAGSSRISCHYDVPTITLDINDYQPIGILGYTTFETLYRQGPVEETLDSLLERILFTKDLPNQVLEFDPTGSLEEDMVLHEHALAQLEMHDYSYFPMKSIQLSRSDRIKKYLISFIGISGFLKIRDRVRTVKYKN